MHDPAGNNLYKAFQALEEGCDQEYKFRMAMLTNAVGVKADDIKLMQAFNLIIGFANVLLLIVLLVLMVRAG